MPRTLYFDNNGIAKEIIIGEYIEEEKEEGLRWVNLRENEDFAQAVPDAIDTSLPFKEDLIEEQRPRTAIFQTLEDNEDTFSIIVVAVPTNEIFKEDDFQLQITIILLRNRIYSIASKANNIVGEIMAKAIHSKQNLTLTILLQFILTEFFEMGIKVIQDVEDYVDEVERKMISSSLSNKLLISLLVLKSRLFQAHKIVKADLEPIREIKYGVVPEIVKSEINDQPEDRSLFLLDQIDSQREDLSNVINLHLAIASNNMNRQFYYLTILGAILVVPTIISSIWGMNVPVPQIDFWTLVIIMFFLTFVSAILVKWFLPKPSLM